MTTPEPGRRAVRHADRGLRGRGEAHRRRLPTADGHELAGGEALAAHPGQQGRQGRSGSDVAGIATNKAHAIQVEAIGFAADSDNWPDSYYENLRRLAAWIEAECGVSSTESVDFESRWHGMSNERWRAYKGHCGHQHVPGQDHWDPGEFRVSLVLGNADAHRNLTLGDEGPDVTALQRAITKRARGCCRSDHDVDVDGVYGGETEKHGAFVGYILGLGDSQGEFVEGGMSTYVQERIRRPELRNETQRERASDRRERHCHCEHEH